MKKFCVALATFIVAASVSVGAANAALTDVPTPTVSGPIPVSAGSYPFLATDIDLEKYGYVEEEFYVDGDDAMAWNDTATNNYDPNDPDEYTTKSKVTTGGPNDDGTYPFKTRMVVRRPADPADFNGTVIAEWLNVTAQYDLEANWFSDPYYLLKHGYAFVGITAQTVGMNALKTFDADRYGDIDVNGDGTVAIPAWNDNDALSFDIYASALKAIKGHGLGDDPMGGLEADLVVASGESQSCRRLNTQYNKIQPVQEIIDAYLLTVCNYNFRTDRPEKVMRILSEREVTTQRAEPDSTFLRNWEVAGGSHIPYSQRRNWAGPVERDRGAQVLQCEKPPLSRVQWAFVQNRATDSLVRWVENDVSPPVAPRNEYVTPTEIARDQHGIALGGIRLPEVDVPVALNTGLNGAAPGSNPFSVFCSILGSYEIFPQEKLGGLYRDFGDYQDKVAASADQVRAQDFVLPEDVIRLKEIAAEFPEIRPTAPMLSGESVNTGTFNLVWRGTRNELAEFDLQSRDADSDWVAVGAPTTAMATVLDKFGEGTHAFRVRSRTTIPETNIDPERTSVTGWSEDLTGIKVDRTGPAAPVVVTGRRPESNRGGGWFKRPVKVTARALADRVLPDGSSGAGLDPASAPKLNRAVSRAGKTVVSVPPTRDLLGNTSPAGRKVIQIDRRKPTIRLTCPKVTRKGKRIFVRVRIKDAQSGVAGKANRKVRVNTRRTGIRRITVRASDRVGNVAKKRCAVRVRR